MLYVIIPILQMHIGKCEREKFFEVVKKIIVGIGGERWIVVFGWLWRDDRDIKLKTCDGQSRLDKCGRVCHFILILILLSAYIG